MVEVVTILSPESTQKNPNNNCNQKANYNKKSINRSPNPTNDKGNQTIVLFNSIKYNLESVFRYGYYQKRD